MKNKELREQMIEFRKAFNSKDEIKNRLKRIANNKNWLEEKDLQSMEELRLSLVFGIDMVKISMEDILNEMSTDTITEENRALYQEFILLSDDAIKLSNELIALIDNIV